MLCIWHAVQETWEPALACMHDAMCYRTADQGPLLAFSELHDQLCRCHGRWCSVCLVDTASCARAAGSGKNESCCSLQHALSERCSQQNSILGHVLQPRHALSAGLFTSKWLHPCKRPSAVGLQNWRFHRLHDLLISSAWLLNTRILHVVGC